MSWGLGKLKREDLILLLRNLVLMLPYIWAVFVLTKMLIWN